MNRPIRIHRVIARLNVGGPAMHVVNLARSMKDTSFQTRLLAGPVGADEGDMEYYAAERGVAVTKVPSLRREVSPLRDAEALWDLYRWFRRERPDVVHTHTAKAGTLGRLAASLAGVPVIVHTYHGHVLGGGYFSPRVTEMYRRIERGMARRSQRLITLTEGLADELAHRHGVAERSHFAVVPLGLELDGFADPARDAEGANVRSELGVPPETRVVGIVGRLVPIKDHELMLQAFSRVASNREDVELWVVGSGEREGALKALADELGVGAYVRWLGWRSDLPRLYRAMDVVALSSRDEGTPVALLEAAAAGVRIVATRVGGIAEMFAGFDDADGVARLVEPGNAEALGEGLAKALTRSMERLPNEVRRGVVDRYSVDRLTADLGSLYRGLLATASPAAPPVESSPR